MPDMLIRPAEIQDAQGILDIYAPFITDSAISFEYEVPTAEQMQARMQEVMKIHPWLVAEESGKVAGYAYAGFIRTRAAYRWSAEVSVYIHPDCYGKGLGKRLYDCLFDLLKLQHVKMLYAGTTVPNEPSERFHQSMGFEKVGEYNQVGFKFGRWYNVAWYQKSLNDSTAEPEEMIRFPMLIGSEGFELALEKANQKIVT